MATRHETQQKKVQLRQSLLDSCRSGRLAPGDVLPPLHELSRGHELSITLVSQVIKQLVEEGVLQTQQGAGTFVSGVRSSPGGVFLLILPPDWAQNSQMVPAKAGFEEKISQLGGTCLTLTHAQAAEYLEQSPGLNPQGMFFCTFQTWQENLQLCARYPGVPRVFFGNPECSPLNTRSTSAHLTASGTAGWDWVHFDDEGGGHTATVNLLKLNHHSVAFMGLHGQGVATPAFGWSAARQRGWEKAMAECGLSPHGLCYGPLVDGLRTIEEQVLASRDVATRMRPEIVRGGITAVLAANCHAARGLFQVLTEGKVPYEKWPALICFGAMESSDEAATVMTEMRLPWDTLGREAAELLWSRASYKGIPRERTVSLKLISRLSSQANWHFLPPAVTRALQLT